LFIALTLLVGFAAINSGANLLHALFGAQMALIIGSGLRSETTVRHASARRLPSGMMHARTPATMTVELTNHHPGTPLLSVSVEDDARHTGEDTCAPVFAVLVPAARTVRHATTVTMARRGRHRLPAAVVATRFPFGLFVKRRELPSPPEVLVYPAVQPMQVSPPRGPQTGGVDATGRVARVGEFHGLREYREGDDPRRIYWPAVAKGHEPMVREHEAQGDTEVMLVLETGRTGTAEFETQVERIASLAVAHLRHPGVAVGLRHADRCVVEPGCGPGQGRRILEFLATVGDPA
jgi:uncharacterized protein (DUF58 family)